MWVPAWDAVQALPGDGASKSQVFPDWGDVQLHIVQLCSCTLCSCAAKCNSVKDALHWSWVHQCNAVHFWPTGHRVHPIAPNAPHRLHPPLRKCNVSQFYAMFCNVLQYFATFCNILQRFATYRNAEDSMQPRSSSANVQKAGYSSLSWSNTKYKYINIKFKTKQGRCETPISWDMDFAIQSFFYPNMMGGRVTHFETAKNFCCMERIKGRLGIIKKNWAKGSVNQLSVERFVRNKQKN